MIKLLKAKIINLNEESLMAYFGVDLEIRVKELQEAFKN